jgi:hypothetical protein
VNSTNERKVSLTAPRFLLAATLLCACGGTQEVRAQAAGRAPPQVQEDVPAQPPGAGSLSDQLNRSKGVITPPAAVSNADPGIVKSPPDTGTTTTMPVIPPPGTPGGDPNVQPK